MIFLRFIFFFFVFTITGESYSEQILKSISLYGNPKYPENFKSFDYVQKDAPKGGAIRLAIIGGFDSIHPYPLTGYSGEGIFLAYDSLFKRALDEPFSCYPRIASSLTLADDESWVIFHLNPLAKFQDQTPLKNEDVVATFTALKEKGPFLLREVFKDIAKVEQVSSKDIKFTFRFPYQRRLVLQLSVMPILSKKAIDTYGFENLGHKLFSSSGPYKILKYVPNKFIEYELVPDYWGKNLPVNAGQFNFTRIRFDYFRNYETAFEAFKAGEIDLFQEDDIGHWLKNYNFPAAKKGDVQLKEIPHQRPKMFGFVFNTRKTFFKDWRIRKAFNLALDIQWLNKTYFHDAYESIESYFANSELAAPKIPSSEEVIILNKFKEQLFPDLVRQKYHLPLFERHAHRDNMHQSLELLKEAGWSIVKNKLVDEKNGNIFEFEILLQNPSYERLALSFKKSLEKLGITTHIRLVDAAQYEQRLRSFDFDMILHHWDQSLAPNLEQAKYWGSKAAQSLGSTNYAGIQDPVIDVLIEDLVKQRDKEGVAKLTHVMDRVLLSGYYTIPLLQKTRDYIAFWNRFGYPKTQPISAFPLLRWWCIQTWWQNDVGH